MTRNHDDRAWRGKGGAERTGPDERVSCAVQLVNSGREKILPIAIAFHNSESVPQTNPNIN